LMGDENRQQAEGEKTVERFTIFHFGPF